MSDDRIPVDRHGWYVVPIPTYRTGEWPDNRLAPWLKENCPGKWKYYITSVSFKDITDAMVFKLTWED
jgi:hypothetical protein